MRTSAFIKTGYAPQRLVTKLAGRGRERGRVVPWLREALSLAYVEHGRLDDARALVDHEDQAVRGGAAGSTKAPLSYPSPAHALRPSNQQLRKPFRWQLSQFVEGWFSILWRIVCVTSRSHRSQLCVCVCVRL